MKHLHKVNASSGEDAIPSNDEGCIPADETQQCREDASSSLRSAQRECRREWMGVEPTAARNATRHRF